MELETPLSLPRRLEQPTFPAWLARLTWPNVETAGGAEGPRPALEPWLGPLRRLLEEGEVSWAEATWVAHRFPHWGVEACLWLALARSVRDGGSALSWGGLFPHGGLWRDLPPPLHEAWQALHEVADAPHSPEGWKGWCQAHSEGSEQRGWVATERGVGWAHFWPFEKLLMEALTASQAQAGNFQPLESEAAIEAHFCHFAQHFPTAFLCGGPGTGKSTLVARSIAYWLQEDESRAMTLQLVAPTARAVQRLLACLQGYAPSAPWLRFLPEPCTLHRWLQHRRGLVPFQEERQPLSAAWVIVDEASMLDTELLCEVRARLTEEARLLLVGDGEQLPSIEPGGWLQHVHACHASQQPHSQLSGGSQIFLGPPAPMWRLTQTHRFQAHSWLGQAVQAVQRSDAPALLKAWEHRDEAWRTVSLSQPEALLQILKEGYRPFFETLKDESATFETLVQSFHDFRLLTFGHQGPYGTRTLNGFLLRQASMKAEEGELPLFRGLPLMVTKNLPHLDLVNGEVGLLWPASEAEAGGKRGWSLRFMKWKGRYEVALRQLEEGNLDLAMVCTVHKAQGSEFRSVALIVPPEQPLLTRAWLYTGMTRAQFHLTLLAETQALTSLLERQVHREHFFF